MLTDEHWRRTVLALLPEQIRTQVPARDTPRLLAIELLQTCERFADGVHSLLDAVRFAVGEENTGAVRLAEALRQWGGP